MAHWEYRWSLLDDKKYPGSPRPWKILRTTIFSPWELGLDVVMLVILTEPLCSCLHGEWYKL